MQPFCKKEMQIAEEIIKSIDLDITAYEDYLKEVSDLMLSQKISNYPIFVLHQEEQVKLGSPIIDALRSKTKWSVNASHLEEFANKNIILAEKLDNFRATYKDPAKHLCIFVFKPQNAGFIFKPFNIKFEG